MSGHTKRYIPRQVFCNTDAAKSSNYRKNRKIMRILLVDTFYGPYLNRLYSDRWLASQSWEQQHQAHFSGSFGTGNSYSEGLKPLGVDAIEIVANSPLLQESWAKRYQPEILDKTQNIQRLMAILEAQINWWKPTVLYIQDINWVPTVFLKNIKSQVSLIVGQNACPLSPELDVSPYDLLLTSLPHYVDKFRSMGVESAYFPIGFDQRLLRQHRTDTQRPHQLTFVGGLGGYHSKGTEMLNSIARELPLQAWGYGGEQLRSDSPLKKCWKGEAWAEDMYSILSMSQITINRHINISKNYACNMRLYEATGMGACLVTDQKSNLANLFKIDEEIVAYNNPEEAAEKIRYLINNPDVARQIAKAGQDRTLKDHTYSKRMEMLLDILNRFIRTNKLNGHIRKFNNIASEINIQAFADSDSFEPAKKWADHLRQKNQNSRIEFHFLVNKSIDTLGEKVWMPEGEASSYSSLLQSFFDCVENSGFVIIFESPFKRKSDLQRIFEAKAIASNLIVRHIRLNS